MSNRPPPKSCLVCGREIEWRKKWERNWDSVRYCSNACRSRKLTDTDKQLEQAILELLSERAVGSSICPSEAARRVAPVTWRELMEPTRMAARRLVDQGRAVIIQQGHEVDPSRAKGPIRIRLK